MTKHRIFIILTILEGLILLGLFIYGDSSTRSRNVEEVPAKKELVKLLELTDLAIWTEARYTRHPSQADLFTPFQDLPSSLEHFPAGSMIAPGPVKISTTLVFQ